MGDLVTPPTWSYTFLDALTDTELATLPMIGVSMEKVLNGTGKLDGFIPTGDPLIRAMDPWTATIPRRTCLAVSYGSTLMWYGMVWARVRANGLPGIHVTAATLDSWVATQLLLQDQSFTNQSAVAIMTGLFTLLQKQAGANFGITVVDGSPAGTTDELRNRAYPATDLKDVLVLMGDFLHAAVPIEWRFDASWKVGGGVQKQLIIGEPRIGRTTDLTNLNVFHDTTRPGSTLLSFTDTDDATVQSNAAVGAMSVPNSAAMWQTSTTAQVSLTGQGSLMTPRTPNPLDPGKLFSYHNAAEVGVDEIAAGFPLIMRPVSTTGQTVNIRGIDDLDDIVIGAVYDGLSQGRAMTNFALGVDTPDVTGYDVGDDMDVEITHVGYPEYPAATTMTVRILGRRITPRGPSAPSASDPFAVGGSGASGATTGGGPSVSSGASTAPDRVDLTVWDADSARLPRSTTLVAHMRAIMRRVQALEQL